MVIWAQQVSFFNYLQIYMADYNKQNMARKGQEKIDTKKSNKPIYKKYTYDVRVKLIKLVRFQKKKVSKVAKQLGICPTTARLILSTWDEEGRVFQKKNQKDRRLRKEKEKKAKEERKNLLKQKQMMRRMKRIESEQQSNIKMQASESEDHIIKNIASLEIKEEAVVPQISYIQNPQIYNYCTTGVYYYVPLTMADMLYY